MKHACFSLCFELPHPTWGLCACVLLSVTLVPLSLSVPPRQAYLEAKHFKFVKDEIPVSQSAVDLETQKTPAATTGVASPYDVAPNAELAHRHAMYLDLMMLKQEAAGAKKRATKKDKAEAFRLSTSS